MSRGPVVLLDGDLLARGRVQEAAAAAGLELRLARSESGAGELVGMNPSLVVVDLDNGREQALAVVTEASAAGLGAPAVGFFSHVDTALGEAAAAAGVTPIRRGRFWATLPEILPQG